MQGNRTRESRWPSWPRWSFGTLAAGCGAISGRTTARRRRPPPQGGLAGDRQLRDRQRGGLDAVYDRGLDDPRRSAPLHADGASSSTELTYDVATAGSAGLERPFRSPQDWSAAPGLTLWVNGRGTGDSSSGSDLRRRARTLGVALQGRLHRLASDRHPILATRRGRWQPPGAARRWRARLQRRDRHGPGPSGGAGAGVVRRHARARNGHHRRLRAPAAPRRRRPPRRARPPRPRRPRAPTATPTRPPRPRRPPPPRPRRARPPRPRRPRPPRRRRPRRRGDPTAAPPRRRPRRPRRRRPPTPAATPSAGPTATPTAAPRLERFRHRDNHPALHVALGSFLVRGRGGQGRAPRGAGPGGRQSVERPRRGRLARLRRRHRQADGRRA